MASLENRRDRVIMRPAVGIGAVSVLVMLSTPAQGSEVPDAAEIETASLVMEGGGQTACIEWPVVVAGPDDEAVERMNLALSYEALNGESIEETMQNFVETQRGITGASYVVNLNERGILDLTIFVDCVGAYPSTFTHFVNLDARTGEPLAPDDLFDIDAMDDLAGLLDSMLQERIVEALEAYTEDSGLDQGIYEGHEFTTDDLRRFSIGPDGVTFHYAFGFPHAALAAEPDGDLFLDYDALLPFLAEDSPLTPDLMMILS